LFTTTPPFVTPKFPSEGLEQLIPQQREGKVVVLFQRVIWDVVEWRVADDLSECTALRANCDKANAYMSLTIIVPADGTKLKGTSGSYGQLGDIVAVTDHALHIDRPKDGLQEWFVSQYLRPAGQVDSIIIRREFFGGLQPKRADEMPPWEPPINTCEGASAGIAIRNPTARAELILHTPQGISMKPDMYRVWRTRHVSSNHWTEEITKDAEKHGEKLKVGEHNIHWQLDKSLLRDAEKEDVTYHVSWYWFPAITSGPVCTDAATRISGGR
jgi:hypothetical protein